jgi:hypothetical protein
MSEAKAPEAQGPKTVKLKTPVTWGSEVIFELTVQKPKAKHVRNLPAEPKTGDLLDLAASLCGQTPRLIDELSIEDMTALMEVVGSFLGGGLKTGNGA